MFVHKKPNRFSFKKFMFYAQIKQWNYLIQIPPLNKQTIFFHIRGKSKTRVKLMGSITTIIRAFITTPNCSSYNRLCIYFNFSKQIFCILYLIFLFWSQNFKTFKQWSKKHFMGTCLKDCFKRYIDITFPPISVEMGGYRSLKWNVCKEIYFLRTYKSVQALHNEQSAKCMHKIS